MLKLMNDLLQSALPLNFNKRSQKLGHFYDTIIPIYKIEIQKFVAIAEAV